MKKIILSICLCISLFFLFYFGRYHSHKSESEVFQAYVANYFQDTLSHDGLSMHFSLLDPSSYGISPSKSSLPIYVTTSFQQYSKSITQLHEELSSIHLEELSYEEQLDYEKLNRSFTLALALADYSYYGNPLSPDSGMQTQLPILLAEYRLTSRDDIQTYFSILESIPNYFQGLSLYMQDRTEAGFLLAHSSLELVASQCLSIITKEQIESDSHFLIETFAQRLSLLLKQSLISPSEYASYLRTNKELLLNSCLLAYEELSQSLLSLESSLESELPLCFYPNGATYYSLQLQSATASTMSMEQMKELLTTSFQDTYLAYYETLEAIQSLQIEAPQSITISLPFSNTSEMVEDLRSQMEADFPPFPSSSSITYEIKEVATSLEPYTAPAFYLTPPIDEVTQNTIYVNYESPLDSLGLYTTLAHEGFPGHLYQSVYHYLDANYPSTQLLTPLLSYLGYVEGWAVYVENLSYEYAKQTLPSSEDTALINLYIDSYRLGRNLQLCFYSLLDLAIHYDGITYADTHTLLAQFGISEPSQTLNVYQYIVNNPTNYPTYYIGYLEVLSCKELACDLWATDYNDLAFHTFFLELGPNNFDVIKEKIALK